MTTVLACYFIAQCLVVEAFTWTLDLLHDGDA